MTELSNRLYQTESANIYIFLSHHSKSKFIIKQILERARELFKDEGIIEFNSDIKFINDLIEKKVDNIDFKKEENFLEIEINEIDDSSIEIENPEENNELNEEIDSISKVNKAFKTIEILGYIIKNRYASLAGDDKSDLVEEMYKLGLRSLTFLFKTLISFLYYYLKPQHYPCTLFLLY